jgi:hypothetical protein
MKEINNGIDDLFKELIEPNEIKPSEGVWETIDNKLNRLELDVYRRSANRYKYLSLGLAIVLLGLGGYEFLTPPKKEQAAVPLLTVNEPKATDNRHDAAPDINSKTFSNPQVQTMGKDKSVEAEKSVLLSASASKHNPVFAVSHPPSNLPSVNSEVAISTPVTIEKRTGLPVAGPVLLLPSIESKEKGAGSAEQIASSPSVASEGLHQIVKDKPADVQLQEIPMQNYKVSGTTADLSLSGQAATEVFTHPSETKAHRFTVLGFYSPEISNRLLTKDHDSDDSKAGSDDDYKEREVAGYSYSSGLKLNYALNGRWSVTAGLGYFSLSQNISPHTVFAETGSNGLQHFVLNTSAGSAELPNQPGKVTQSADSLMINSTTQVLKFINFPLTLQYGKAIKRFTLYAYAGASLNYLFGQKMVVELPTSSGLDKYSITNVNGVNKFNLGVVAGFGAGYSLSSRWSLHAEPGLKASITPINSNSLVKSYPYSFGLSCGLGYHF